MVMGVRGLLVLGTAMALLLLVGCSYGQAASDGCSPGGVREHGTGEDSGMGDSLCPQGVDGGSGVYDAHDTVRGASSYGAWPGSHSTRGSSTSISAKRLYQAAGYGDMPAIEGLVANGVGLEYTDSDGWTPLLYASAMGHTQTVHFLLDAGADVHARSSYGYTSLIDAAANGYSAVVQLLIDAGADVDAQSHSGRSALHDAASNGHLEVVEILLDSGADIMLQDGDRKTGFDWAVDRDHYHIAHVLTPHGPVQ